jgi:hypothetical protein
MYENLERYLREISHYLNVERGTDEILAEIKSHILEKAAQETDAVTRDSIQRIIDAYGSPREVAAKYMEGREIIAPTLKKYLFRYTAILYAIHLVLTVIAIHFRTSIIAIPFFFIPRMPVWAALIYLPMALVYDFGVVALILYFVTQRKGEVRLPWFGASFERRGESGLRRPKAWLLAVRIVLLSALLCLFVRYHTIFLYSINFNAPESLLNPVSSVFFSIMFIAAYACHVIAYWVRFLFNSAWVQLVERLIILLILWVVWNSPIRPVYRAVPGVDLSLIGALFVSFVIAVAVLGFLRSLARVTREMSLP